MKLAILSALSAFFLSASPNAWSAQAEPALQLSMSIQPDVGEKLSKQLPQIINAALAMVAMFPPQGYENNMFTWSADRGILAGKSLHLMIATSRNPTVSPLIANSGTLSMDAFTMAPMNLTDKTMPIFVVLLVDKIFYDSQRNELPDGFSRLVLALAHEIYGNVQHFLEFNMEGAKAQTMADRVKQELNAYRASLLFLRDLPTSNKFASLPENTRNGLLNLLPLEIIAYTTWKLVRPGAMPDPACEAMLASLANKSRP